MINKLDKEEGKKRRWIEKSQKNIIDDDLSDKVVKSKKLFQFENEFITAEERRKRDFEEAMKFVDLRIRKNANLIDPRDSELNYNRVQKLSREYVYEVIEEQIQKYTKTQEIIKVFVKKNENVNFFFCDNDGIIENQDIDLIREDFKKSNKNLINNRKGSQALEFIPYKAEVLRDCISQGKSFFFIQKKEIYEVEKETEDGVYVELRNKDNPDMIGIFKKEDIQKVLVNDKLPVNSSILNTEDFNKNGGVQDPEFDEKSETSSNKFNSQVYNTARKKSTSRGSFLNTSGKGFLNSKASTQFSTTQKKIY